jgi:hypothetical protein
MFHLHEHPEAKMKTHGFVYEHMDSRGGTTFVPDDNEEGHRWDDDAFAFLVMRRAV